MAIKRRNKITAEFSMASMTDVIFLLLIFFLITSTVVAPPSAIKVQLPKSKQETAVKPLTRITVDSNLNYYVGFAGATDTQVAFDEIAPFLRESYLKDPEMYVAIYADETIPYGDVVKVIDVVQANNYKMILVTRPR